MHLSLAWLIPVYALLQYTPVISAWKWQNFRFRRPIIVTERQLLNDIPPHNIDSASKRLNLLSKRFIAFALSVSFCLGDGGTAEALYSSSSEAPPFPTKGYQTQSGLRYFDLKEGTMGHTPRYGQFVAFRYASFYRPSATGKLELIDTSDYGAPKGTNFVNKHGNRRVIKAIDEALHTMKVGGRRRIIVSNKLGFIDSGLGPLPLKPSGRKRLGDVIDRVAEGKGDLIYDVDLVLIADDENDQGFYDDEAVTIEEIQESIKELMKNREVLDSMRSKEVLKQTQPIPEKGD